MPCRSLSQIAKVHAAVLVSSANCLLEPLDNRQSHRWIDVRTLSEIERPQCLPWPAGNCIADKMLFEALALLQGLEATETMQFSAILAVLGAFRVR